MSDAWEMEVGPAGKSRVITILCARRPGAQELFYDVESLELMRIQFAASGTSVMRKQTPVAILCT